MLVLERLAEQRGAEACRGRRLDRRPPVLLPDQQELFAAWNGVQAEFDEAASTMNELCRRHFAAWDSPGFASQNTATPSTVTPVVQFGESAVSWSAGENGNEVQTRTLPAVLAYPACPSLLLEAEDEGREVAAKVLQNVMLRLLTTFPPGKVKVEPKLRIR